MVQRRVTLTRDGRPLRPRLAFFLSLRLLDIERVFIFIVIAAAFPAWPERMSFLACAARYRYRMAETADSVPPAPGPDSRRSLVRAIIHAPWDLGGAGPGPELGAGRAIFSLISRPERDLS